MYAFVDHPRPCPLAGYSAATERFVARMAARDGVLAVYQLGSVADPGISDLDFLVVTADGYRSTERPQAEVPASDRYILVHGPVAVAASDFPAALRFGCFHNLRHLWGERLETAPARDAKESAVLERQIALEYLVQMFVNLTVQRAYRVVKLRGLFLHVKALRYDLEFLGVADGPLWDLVEQLIAWRRQWLAKRVATATLGLAIEELWQRLPSFVEEQIASYGFYLPESSFALAPNIDLAQSTETAGAEESSARLRGRRRGLLLPRFLHALGANYFKLQHRLNRFEFECPFATAAMPGPVAERFRFLAQLRRYHADHLPGFMRPMSSLNAA